MCVCVCAYGHDFELTNTFIIIIIPDATVLTLSSISVLYCTVCHFLKYGMEDPNGHRPRGESNPDPAAQLMGSAVSER